MNSKFLPFFAILLLLLHLGPARIKADEMHRRDIYLTAPVTEIPGGVQITVEPQKSYPYLTDVKVTLSGEAAAKYRQGSCLLIAHRFQGKGRPQDARGGIGFTPILRTKPYFEMVGGNLETIITYRTANVHQLQMHISYDPYKLGDPKTWEDRKAGWEAQTDEAKRLAKGHLIYLVWISFKKYSSP